jgi:hypothetical protein
VAWKFTVDTQLSVEASQVVPAPHSETQLASWPLTMQEAQPGEVVVQETAWTGTQAPFWQAVPAPQAGVQGMGMQLSLLASQVVPVPHFETQLAFWPLTMQEAQPGEAVVQETAWTGTQAPFWQAVPAPQAGVQAMGMHWSPLQTLPAPQKSAQVFSLLLQAARAAAATARRVVREILTLDPFAEGGGRSFDPAPHRHLEQGPYQIAG